MIESAATSFADLLKQYRAAAGLTQEELAERANLSARGLSDLERGIRCRPYGYTVQRLIQALALGEEDAARFSKAARRVGGGGKEPGTSAQVEGAFLPLSPTSFIGREQEVAEVSSMLRREEVRLLTLTGPGGIGKTRLALEVARKTLDSFPDGVALVSLASLADPDLVPVAIADALAIRERGGQSIMQTLLDRLRSKRVVLVLDNFEHLLLARQAVSSLLASCPRLKILATSRAVLHLSAEHEYPVPPLPVPVPGHLPELGALSRYDAVQLFLQRAEAIKPGFQLTKQNAAAIAGICFRLDGLPLAIELAAARIRVFPPQALLSRLGHPLQVLTSGAVDEPVRLRSVRGAIDWSYHLLNSDEQALFARPSVFAGGCTLEAAEQVCNPEGELDTLDTMSSLVDKSFVYCEGEGEPRFKMLETIREYGAERRVERGEDESVRQAHALYFLSLAERAEPDLWGASEAHCVRRLNAENDNLRAAIDWFRERSRGEEALRLAWALGRFWFLGGYWSEGQQQSEAALQVTCEVDPKLRARVLLHAGNLAKLRTQRESATLHLEEALRLFHDLNDEQGEATALNLLGELAYVLGEDLGRARSLYEQGLMVARRASDGPSVCLIIKNLARVDFEEEDFLQAWVRYEEALTMYRDLGNTWRIAECLNEMGEVAVKEGDLNRAKALLAESLDTVTQLGSGSWPFAVTVLAEVSALEGEYVLAAQLMGAFEAAWEVRGVAWFRLVRATLNRVVEACRAQIGEPARQQAWEDGRALSLDEAVALARAYAAGDETYHEIGSRSASSTTFWPVDG